MKTIFRQRLMTSTLLLGVAGMAAPAFAQDNSDQAQVPSAEEQEGSIVVTGSRIARPQVESTSPVTVVGAQEVEQSGATRVEDLVNALPQVTPSQTAFVSNGATGTATVNLRGIGPVRTLVLVNGRRLQPGTPLFPVADLNQIPASLVERIEVSTGGASSVYGADAVAGVVNFIMDTDFEGFQVDAQYGVYQHNNRSDQVIDSVGGNEFTIIDRLNSAAGGRGYAYPVGNVVDGATFSATALLGAGFDDGRGNVVAYLGYRQVDPILQSRRDHSACALSLATSGGQGPGNQPDGRGRINCGGSATSPAGTIADLSFGDHFFGVPDGQGGWDGAFISYNYAPVNYFQRPDKRWTAGAFAEYEVSPGLKPYAEFMFMDDRSVAQIAESGTFFADVINLSCDSPLLSARQGEELCDAIDGVEGAGDFVDTDGDGVADTDPTGAGVVPIIIGKRNVEGGPRASDLRHTSYRMVLGSRGDISPNWSYDVSGQYGTSIYSQTYLNDLSRSRLRRALQAGVDANGNIVCSINVDADPANDDQSCRPYNPFQGEGLVSNPAQGITQEAIDYVVTPGLQRGGVEEYIVSGYVTGSLFNLMSDVPVSAVFGAEYREEQLELQVDSAFATGDLAGQGGPQPAINGSFSVKDLFAELLVPIISDRPFFHNLALELGYRYSDYSTGVTTDTYKLAGEFSPIREVKFRGGYNRAVRAPNVLELFTPTRLALFGGTDPCSGTAPDFTLQQCQRTGVTAAQYGSVASSPADQYNQLVSGNPNLEPEVADTWTAGIVIEPRELIPNLVITVDYFDIKVKNAIGGFGANTILQQCGLTGEEQFCSLIQRNPISGDLWVGSDESSPLVGRVINFTRNIGGIETTGVDIGMAYNRRVGPGRFNIDFQGTWLDELITDNGFVPAGLANADGRYDCAGFHGGSCGFPSPEWRHYVRGAYTFDNGVGISVRWRHLGSVRYDEFSTDPDLSTDTTPDARTNIGSFDWFDLTLNFNVSDEFRMLVGVNNIFDKDPPLFNASVGGDNANTWAGSYDPVGRYMFVSGTLRF